MKRKSYVVEILLTCFLIALLLFKVFPFWEQEEIKEDDKTNEEFKQFETAVKASSKYPEQERIHQKIVDSIDYFKTVEGEYEVVDVEIDSTQKITYYIDSEHKRGRSSFMENNQKEKTVIYNENKKITFDDSEGTYQEFSWHPVKKDEKLLKMPPNKRYLNETGSQLSRQDAGFIGYASQSINFELSFLLMFYEDWKIESEIEYLDLPAYKITGVVSEKLSDSLKGNFEMIVEKNTGIVLDFRSFDDNGQIKYSITTKKIKLNQEMDSQIFLKDTSEYKKIKL